MKNVTKAEYPKNVNFVSQKIAVFGVYQRRL
jgi:hypothetical protein